MVLTRQGPVAELLPIPVQAPQSEPCSGSNPTMVLMHTPPSSFLGFQPFDGCDRAISSCSSPRPNGLCTPAQWGRFFQPHRHRQRLQVRPLQEQTLDPGSRHRVHTRAHTHHAHARTHHAHTYHSHALRNLRSRAQPQKDTVLQVRALQETILGCCSGAHTAQHPNRLTPMLHESSSDAYS